MPNVSQASPAREPASGHDRRKAKHSLSAECNPELLNHKPAPWKSRFAVGPTIAWPAPASPLAHPKVVQARALFEKERAEAQQISMSEIAQQPFAFCSRISCILIFMAVLILAATTFVIIVQPGSDHGEQQQSGVK